MQDIECPFCGPREPKRKQVNLYNVWVKRRKQI
jgi:hypothetical protein